MLLCVRASRPHETEQRRHKSMGRVQESFIYNLVDYYVVVDDGLNRWLGPWTILFICADTHYLVTVEDYPQDKLGLQSDTPCKSSHVQNHWREGHLTTQENTYYTLSITRNCKQHSKRCTVFGTGHELRNKDKWRLFSISTSTIVIRVKYLLLWHRRSSWVNGFQRDDGLLLDPKS